jgi:2-(1,2-epoxy-1,2-dihydrophenyl)acetyl-CoA isomerase
MEHTGGSADKMAGDTVLRDFDDGVLTLTLNRPDSLNALDRAGRQALATALADAARADVRAVVLTGAGRGFSVGQDVAELRADYETAGPALADLIHHEWAPLVEAIRTLPKPVVAAVNGPAAGGGLSLALAADIRLAEPRTSFIAAFVNVGLVPDSGAAHMLIRSLGLSRAMRLALTGDRLTAEDALAAGLVAAISPADRLLDDAKALARRFTALPPLALAAVKRVMHHAADSTFAAVVDFEAERQDVLGRSADHQEAIRAFLDKRPPRFEGR